MSVEERKLGADAMEQEFVKVFSKSGKTIESFKWVPELSSDFSSCSYHTVEVTSGSALYILENIPREVLDDYPGKRGNEVINFYISKLVSVPHIDLKKVHDGSFVL
jgi:hypothetical protein